VERDGSRKAVALTSAIALSYATAAAKAFGVGKDERVAFKKDLAQADLKEGDEKKATPAAKAKR